MSQQTCCYFNVKKCKYFCQLSTTSYHSPIQQCGHGGEWTGGAGLQQSADTLQDEPLAALQKVVMSERLNKVSECDG